MQDVVVGKSRAVVEPAPEAMAERSLHPDSVIWCCSRVDQARRL
jgi:hypothetical protein